VTRSNDAYAWQAHYNVYRAYLADGLNRIMSAGGVPRTVLSTIGAIYAQKNGRLSRSSKHLGIPKIPQMGIITAL